MKELILLVGPQASGKTTYAKKIWPLHYRVSQDDMGPKEHFICYQAALKGGRDIIVDRINHTKEQRAKYINEARQYGYNTKIVELYETYDTCFKRGSDRKDHPTIKDDVTLKKALQMYFDKYEYISDNEADVVLRHTNNPIVLDLTNLYNSGKRFILIGDLHGCFDELQALLNQVNYNKNNDVVLLAGDLVDRGPKILECLKFLIENDNVYSVQGNHDNKFLRWLNKSNVNLESLKETIDQVKNEQLGNLHYNLYNKLHHTIIKFGNNYLTHAGFHPYYHPEQTSREFSLYARIFDTNLGTFTRSGDTKWYDVKRKYPMFNLFFGHDVNESKCKVAEGVYSLDSGCVFGHELRCMVMHNNRLGYDSIKSGFSVKKDVEWDHMNKFEPYDKLVEQGFLRKQESGDLVLYNYTEKCTYEKHWNNYTMECRGLILDKNTGDTVARPFPKFFNVGELESPSLPKMPIGESYEVYEKVDGSLGILYYHPNEQMWKIATRGSFESDQAKKATLMFRKVVKGIIKDMSHTDLYIDLLNKYSHYKDYTLCFEIIYPENRMNDGARLVCDYGTKETLILLGAINKVTGKDLDYDKLKFIADYIGTPLAKKYNYTIEQLMEMKKTLPMQEEGWVVRFTNGFRVKVKGDEYCKMARILNSINPLAIWEVMKENKVMSDRLELPYVYKMNLPEELLPEVNYLESKVKELFLKACEELHHEFAFAYTKATNEYPDNIKKGLGLQLQNLKHRSAIFPYYENKWQQVNNYVMMYIRPKGNEFNE